MQRRLLELGAWTRVFPIRVIVQYDQHMLGKALRLVLVAVFIVTLATACGGSSGKKNTTATQATTTPAKLPFKAVISAPSHHPVMNKNWPIAVTVSNLSGKPIAATLQMNVLLGSVQIGQIDNGKIYHFVGRHHENIVWPQQAVGNALTLQAVVKVKGKTMKLPWAVSVVAK